MVNSQQVQMILRGPAMAPPPGIEPNFVDPQSLYQYHVLTIVLTVAISTLALVMRIYTKRCIIRKVGAEDYASILGYFMFIGYCVPTSLIMRNGGGIHQWNVPLKSFISILYYINIAGTMYCVTVFIIKLSILLQYLKIFGAGQRGMMFWGTHIAIGLNFAFYLAAVFVGTFLCNPREKYWNVLLTTGHCYSRNAANITSGFFNSISDLVILLLPQRVIWKLQMPLKRKLGVSAIFLTGLFVCLTSIIRLYYAISLAQSDDVTYNITLMGFWTYAELSVGIVCGCLPIFPKFLQTFGKKLAAMNGYGASIRTLLKKSIPGRRSTKGSQTSDKTRIWEDPYAIRLESFGGNIKTDARTRQRNDISYEHV